MSFVGRLLRPVALLAAALFVSHASLSVAAPATAATTLTRTTSCAAMNFHPVDSDTEFGFRRGQLLRYFTSGSGYFLCDPGLPNKATVTRVRFTVVDKIEVAEVRYCALVRKSLAASAYDGEPQVMAQTSGTGVSSKPGAVRQTDSSISRATIDETSYGYWLQCQIYFPSSTSTDGVGIIGADVTYTISSTNG
jgi:hypothetical protein